MTETILAILVIAATVCGATGYVIKAKKKGQSCIGCPHAGQCQKACIGAGRDRRQKPSG